MSADDIVLAPGFEEPEGDIARATGLSEAAQKSNGGHEAAPTMSIAGVPSDSESLMPEGAAIALSRGDPVTLDELARQLRSESRSVLADRLDAMARLVRANVGDALRMLREAKVRANQAGPSERCRASLALSVAIAAAGRPSDALLEVLKGWHARGARATCEANVPAPSSPLNWQSEPGSRRWPPPGKQRARGFRK